jgi:oligopeptide transport system substrate-binding protein
MNEKKDGYEVVCEMASELPQDVTKKYAGNTTYKVPTDAENGYAWTFELNKNAKWEDGTSINADDYVYGFQQFLNPEMKNYRASIWYEGNNGIVNAKEYYAGGISYENIFNAADNTYVDVPDSAMYFSLTQKSAFFDDTLANGYAGYGDSFMDGDVNMYTKLQNIVGDMSYVPLTDEIKGYLVKIGANLGSNYADAYKEFCFQKKELEQVNWDQVGVIKNNDYSITLVLAQPTTQFFMEYGWVYDSTPLLKKDLYEANKKKTGSIVKSSYGTAVENYMSFGPYKIVSYQPEKEMRLTKNKNWYGYTDGKHEGEFETTDIYVQYIDKHETRMSLFLQGKLSSVGLESSEIEKYGNSDYIQYRPQSYTWKITMNNDIKTLKAEESVGVNHSILSYKDFRHGIFLSLDRQTYAATVQPQDDPGYGLINYLYVADPATGELYRDTPEAKEALNDVYGVKNEEDMTGYNKAEAKKLFVAAYEQCLADGNIKPSDKIQLDYHTYDGNENNVKMVEFVQSSINAAVAGTELEGKITLKQVIDEDYYDNLKQGAVDMARTAWGGADYDPYGILQCYSTEDYKNEYGFHPEVETLTITIDGKEITKTYKEWYNALCGGEYTTAPAATKNYILAQNEKGLLEMYTMAPLTYSNGCGLNSQRIIQGSDHFIDSLVGFGGIRAMTWTMDDNEWVEYCSKHNNQLNY